MRLAIFTQPEIGRRRKLAKGREISSEMSFSGRDGNFVRKSICIEFWFFIKIDNRFGCPEEKTQCIMLLTDWKKTYKVSIGLNWPKTIHLHFEGTICLYSSSLLFVWIPFWIGNCICLVSLMYGKPFCILSCLEKFLDVVRSRAFLHMSCSFFPKASLCWSWHLNFFPTSSTTLEIHWCFQLRFSMRSHVNHCMAI